MEYKKNLIPGIVLTIFSIIYLVLTSQIKKFSGLGSDPLGARAIPYLWGISSNIGSKRYQTKKFSNQKQYTCQIRIEFYWYNKRKQRNCIDIRFISSVYCIAWTSRIFDYDSSISFRTNFNINAKRKKKLYCDVNYLHSDSSSIGLCFCMSFKCIVTTWHIRILKEG